MDNRRMKKTILSNFKKITQIKIHYKEIIIVLSILFFTSLFNYVDFSPILIKYVHQDRMIQLVAVFVVSLSFILSFRGTLDIKFEFIVNAMIITLIFGFLTKPKPKLKKFVEHEIKQIKNHLHKPDQVI
jgi:hypothetical protein